MARRKSHLRQALSLMWRTRPFLRVRLAVYSVFFFATIGYFSITVLLLLAGGTRAEDGTVSYSAVRQVIVLAAAMVLYVLGRRYTGHYLTNAGQAPHLYTMVAAMKGEPLPKGPNQIDWATARLEESYPDTSRFVHLEALVGKALRQIQAEVLQLGARRASEGGRKPSKLTPLFQRLATRTIRGAVVGYAFWVGRPNVYHSARRSLARYAQAADPVARSALRVWVLGLVVGLILVGLLLAAAWNIVTWAEQSGPVLLTVVVAGLVKAGWVLKTAFYDPIGQAWMLSVFIRHVDEQPSPEVELVERLEAASKHFRELGVRAKEFEAQGSAAKVADKSDKAAEKADKMAKVEKPGPKAGESAESKTDDAPLPRTAPRKAEALPAVPIAPPPDQALSSGPVSSDGSPKIEINLDQPEPPHKG